jgi:tetratricopeptide (TPR) repeat protein
MYDDLADSCFKEKRSQEALETLNKYSHIRLKLLPVHHLDIARTYVGLPQAYTILNEHVEASVYLHKALSIEHDSLPASSASLSNTYNLL